MLHHVSVEIHPDFVGDCVACWRLLGFEPIEAPRELRGYVTWLEREETHIHLIHSQQPTIPQLGHAAVVVEDFDDAFAALEGAGHSPKRHPELWDEPRAFLTMPGGHRVELMAAPPPGTV